jgi:Mg-chelatase subunit ChlD
VKGTQQKIMLDSLKKAASNFFGGEEMDRILGLPITQLRLDLKKAFKEKKFDAQQFDAFVERIRTFDDISTQIDIAKKAVNDREVADELDIELNTPAKQLLWAATLTRMMDAGREPVERSKLWGQLQGTIGLHNEGIAVAKVISASLQNDDVTFDWGTPGSWFYHDPIKNHINLDLYFMLLTGFEHVRAIHLHEIGHSELSDGSYPPRMKELYKTVEKMVDPRSIDADGAPPQKKTKNEQKQLALEVGEWQLWHRAWNSMEDICVDQFAIDMKHKLPQDMGDSLNHAAMVLRGYAEILRGDDTKGTVQIKTDEAPGGSDDGGTLIEKIQKRIREAQEKQNEKAQEAFIKLMTEPMTDQQVKDVKAGKISPEIANKMYNEITRASLLAGYEKNGLFSDQDKNWARFRVFPDDIRRTVDMSKVPDANGRDAFEYLCDLSAAVQDSVRTSQPQPSDRILVKPPHTTAEDSYRAVVAEMAEKRAQIMGKIWDIYIKPYADVLLKEFEKQVENNLDNKNKPQQGKQQGQQGQGQQGEGQQGQGGGEGESDPNQQSDGQSGGGQSGKGGQQQEKKNGFPDDPQTGGMPNAGGGEDQSGAGGDENDDKGNDQNKSGGGAGDDDTPQELDDDLKEQIKGMAKDPKEKEDLDNKKNQQAGAGQDKKDGDKPEDGKDAEGRGGPGWDHDPQKEPQNPKKVGDERKKDVVKEDISEEQKQAMKEAAKNMPKSQPGDLSSNQGGSQRGVDLAALAKGDWRDFNKRMLELSPVINRTAQAYMNIRAEQRRQILRQSKNLDYMAEDGDILERLNRDRMLETKFRKATGQKLSPDDFKKFHEDTIASTESTIEAVFMIDGSGSMPGVRLSNGVTAMEAALQSAAIGYMACRKAGIDSYILIWGDAQPIVVATPESNPREVGERLEALRNGTGSGTDLAPGIIKTVESMAEHKNKNGTISGSSHILVFSDGDIFDPAQASKALETVSKNGKNLSIDVAVLNTRAEGSTQMEKVFQGVIDRTGGRLVGIMHGNDPETIPLDLARLMLKRVRSFQVKSEPDNMKRQRLRKLHKDLSN